MTVVLLTNVLFISMVTVGQSMSYYQRPRPIVDFPILGTYRNCDICAVTTFSSNPPKHSEITKSSKPERNPERMTSRCSINQLCRAVGTAGSQARPRCIDAGTLTPASATPMCARGSGDTAVTADGTMIKCTESDDCPMDFVCTSSGACCRDVSQCQKVGNCPAHADYCGTNNICSTDSDCKGDAKCCSYSGCEGSRCIMPLFTGK